MITLDTHPKTISNLPTRKLNWVVRPAPQVYTCEEVHGSLAEETSAWLASREIIADPVRDVEPEDFEAAYQWFYA